MNQRHPHHLDPDHAILLIVDMQEKFQPTIHNFDAIVARTAIVIQAAALLKVPILVAEQYPQRLGATVAPIKAALPADVTPMDKTIFSSCGSGALAERLEQLGRKQVMLCGIETHVCMNQTAHDLLLDGYQVHVLADCTSARTVADREVGLAKMYRSGAFPSTSEMAIFELLRDSKHEHFKAISKLIK
jgi:nicotinamidase-related amidase